MPLRQEQEDGGYLAGILPRRAVNGDVAGIVSLYGDKYAQDDLIVTVVDVRRSVSRSVRRSVWALGFRGIRPEVGAGVGGFVLSPLGAGAIAYSWTTPWTVASFDPLRAPDRFDTLDTGVEPRGLRLTSRTEVAWVRDGQERRGSLPGAR